MTDRRGRQGFRRLTEVVDPKAFLDGLRAKAAHAHRVGVLAAHPTLEEGGRRALPEGFQWCGKDMPGGDAARRRLAQRASDAAPSKPASFCCC